MILLIRTYFPYARVAVTLAIMLVCACSGRTVHAQVDSGRVVAFSDLYFPSNTYAFSLSRTNSSRYQWKFDFIDARYKVFHIGLYTRFAPRLLRTGRFGAFNYLFPVGISLPLTSHAHIGSWWGILNSSRVGTKIYSLGMVSDQRAPLVVEASVRFDLHNLRSIFGVAVEAGYRHQFGTAVTTHTDEYERPVGPRFVRTYTIERDLGGFFLSIGISESFTRSGSKIKTRRMRAEDYRALQAADRESRGRDVLLLAHDVQSELLQQARAQLEENGFRLHTRMNGRPDGIIRLSATSESRDYTPLGLARAFLPNQQSKRVTAYSYEIVWSSATTGQVFVRTGEQHSLGRIEYLPVHGTHHTRGSWSHMLEVLERLAPQD